MKKLLTLIFIIFSFYAYSNAPAEDLKIGDCVVTNYKDLDLTTKETKACISELTEKGTKQQQKNNSIAVGIPSAAKSFLSSSSSLINIMILLSIIYAIHRRMDYNSTSNDGKFKEFFVKNTLKIAVISFIAIIVSNDDLSEYALGKSLDYLNATMLTQFDTSNRINSQSKSINNIALQESNSKFSNKISKISESVYFSEFCAMSYKQELISKYNKSDLDVITDDPELDCIEETYSKVLPKSLSDRANMQPLAFAVNYCSNKNDSVSVSCGKVNFKVENKKVSNIIDKYSLKLTALASEYRAIMCSQSKKIDEEKFEVYCRNYYEGVFSESSSDVTRSVYESKLRETVTKFQSDLSLEIIESARNELKKEKEDSKGNDNLMLNTADQVKKFMSVNYDSAGYSSKIDTALRNISFIKPSKENLNVGSISRQKINSNKINSSADFYAYLAENSKLFFEINNSILADTFQDYSWLKDSKTLVGYYSDATKKEDFKVDVNTFRAVDRNRVSLFMLGSGAKIAGTYGEYRAKGKDAGIYSLLNTYGTVAIALSFYPEISSNIVIAYMVVIYLKLIITSAIVIVFQIMFTAFVSKDVESLFDEMINISFAIALIPISLVCAMLASSGIVVVGINVLESVGITDNVSYVSLFINLTAVMTLIIISAYTFYKMFFETHNFAEGLLNTNSDKITDQSNKVKELASTIKPNKTK